MDNRIFYYRVEENKLEGWIEKKRFCTKSKALKFAKDLLASGSGETRVVELCAKNIFEEDITDIEYFN